MQLSFQFAIKSKHLTQSCFGVRSNYSLMKVPTCRDALGAIAMYNFKSKYLKLISFQAPLSLYVSPSDVAPKAAVISRTEEFA